jgi:hypothetical protein
MFQNPENYGPLKMGGHLLFVRVSRNLFKEEASRCQNIALVDRNL